MNKVASPADSIESAYTIYTELYKSYLAQASEKEKIEQNFRKTFKDNKTTLEEFGKTSLIKWFGRYITWRSSTGSNVDEKVDGEKALEIMSKVQSDLRTEDKYKIVGKLDMLVDNLTIVNKAIMSICLEMLKLTEVVNNSENTFNLIKTLCGGPEKFNALPVLDLGNQNGYTGSIDFITPDMMTAPVMRFTDRMSFPGSVSGRQGIAVCAIREGSSVPQVQAFFQRNPGSGEWHDGACGPSIIPIDGYLVKTGLVRLEAFKTLKELLRDGHCYVTYPEEPGKQIKYTLFDPVKEIQAF